MCVSDGYSQKEGIGGAVNINTGIMDQKQGKNRHHIDHVNSG